MTGCSSMSEERRPGKFRSLTLRAVVTLLMSGILAGQLLAAPPPPPGPLQKVPTAKPDLIVLIQKVFCQTQVGNNLQLKLRVQNASNNPTWKHVWTQVLLDSPDPAVGIPFLNTPFVVTAPLSGGHVKHVNVPITPGPHKVYVKTDWNNQQPETNEGNNTAVQALTFPDGDGCRP